jgi:Leucyl-tRNA synthetase
MQKNWIGKSKGVEIKFTTDTNKEIKAFTTRPDTLFGVTFFGISPNHPIVKELSKNDKDLVEFLSEIKKVSSAEADLAKAEKIRLQDRNLIFVHPITGKNIPVWIINYVLMDYGTGAINGSSWT